MHQDHELVQVSLESSERIRKQQKELITLLQRSGGGGGVGGIVAGTGPGGGTLDLLGASFSNSTVSTAAENRDWCVRVSITIIITFITITTVTIIVVIVIITLFLFSDVFILHHSYGCSFIISTSSSERVKRKIAARH